MAKPIQYDFSSQVRSQGVPRKRAPTQFGIPTGTTTDKQTVKEQEEEERRGISVPGFFGSILDKWETIDRPISERLGIRIPDLPGPFDEAGNLALQELTRPSTLGIALGGVGLAGKLGRGASLARQAAARSTGAQRAALRGLGAGARVGQFAVAPVAGARGLSFPTRLAAEAGTVAGFRAASEKTAESIPETAPGLFKIGAPLAVGLLGGLGGARATMGAMKRLNINVANEKALAAGEEALDKQEFNKILERRQTRKKELQAELMADSPEIAASRRIVDSLTNRLDREQQNIGKLLRKPDPGTDEGRLRIRQQIDDARAKASETETDLAKERQRVAEADREIGTANELKQKRREALWADADARADILGARSGDDVRRRAHIREYATRVARNQQEIRKLADDIASGQFRTADGTLIKNWDETPGFLGGREDAALLQHNWAMRGMAGGGHVSNKIIEFEQIMKDAEVDGRSLESVILEDGTVDPWLRDNGILDLAEDGSYKFTEKGKPYEDAIEQIRGEIDVQREAERLAGIEFEDITGESLADIPDEVVEVMRDRWNAGTMPYFGDIVERLGDARGRGYFPRFVSEGSEALLSGGQRSFGGAFFEEGRLPGFSQGAEYQRQMFENAKDMRNANPDDPGTYLGDVTQVMGLRLKAGVDRINAKWLQESLTRPVPGIGQMTLLDRLMSKGTWASARKSYLAAQGDVIKITKALSGIRAQAVSTLRTREARAMAKLNTQMPKLVAGTRDHAVKLADAIDNMTTDMREAGLEGRKYFAKLKDFSTKLREVGDDNDIHKVMELIRRADTEYLRGDKSLTQRIANMSQTKRAAFDLATNQSQDAREFLRETNAHTLRMNQLDGRILEIEDELGSVQKVLADNIPAQTRVRDLLDNLEEAKAKRDTARTAYEYAQQSAGAPQAAEMISGRQAKLNNFISGGRFYDAEFADEMNKFFEMADRQGIGGIMRKFNDFSRPLMATLDLSAIGIQGLLAAGVDPIGAAKMMTRTTLALFSPRFYNRWVVKNKGTIDDFIKEGGYFAALDDVGEFLFPGGLTKAPLIGKPIKLANHHFSRTGNALRIMLYKNAKNNSNLIGRALGKGALARAKGLGESESIIQSINEATGFKAGNPSTLSSAIFFAPRYFNSQLSLLQKAASQPGADGRLARDYLMRTMALMGLTTYWMNEMQGYDTDWSPVRYDAEGNPHYNSNFMRINAAGQDVSLFGTWDSLAGLFGTMVTEGPSSGAVRLFRTKASPALGTVFDVITEETFMGEPVKLRSDDPREIGLSVINLMQQKLPFTLQDTIEDVTGTPNFNITDVDTYGNPLGLGLISNVVGLKATPQTPYERRDIRAQEIYGKDWKQLTRIQKSEVEQKYPEIVEAIDARLEKRAASGDVGAQAQIKKEELAAELFQMERNLAVAVESGQIPRDQLSKIYGDLQRTFAAQKRVIDEMHGLDYALSEDPNLQALDAWFELYDDPEVKLFGNHLDWDILDQKQMELRTTFTDEQNNFLSGYLETDYTRHPEEIHEFIRYKNYVNASGYWDAADEAFQEVADRVSVLAGRPVSTYSELERLIRQTPDIRTKRRLEGIKRAIDSRKDAKRVLMRRRDPQLDIALVLTRGYTPRTAQGRSLISR